MNLQKATLIAIVLGSIDVTASTISLIQILRDLSNYTSYLSLSSWAIAILARAAIVWFLIVLYRKQTAVA